MTISWTAPGSGSAVSGYRILRGTDAGNLSAIAPDTGSTGTEYTDSTVAAETTYHYGVLALSQDGDGAQSATISATTQAAPQDKGSKGSNKGDSGNGVGTRDAPAVPLNLDAEVGDGKLTFTWDPPASTGGFTIIRYNFEFGPTGNLVSEDHGTNPTGSQTVTKEGLTNGTEYIFKVRAVNMSGGVTTTGHFVSVRGTPNTALRVTSIERQLPTSSPTDADTLTWRVTFNEAVQNVNAADFLT